MENLGSRQEEQYAMMEWGNKIERSTGQNPKNKKGFIRNNMTWRLARDVTGENQRAQNLKLEQKSSLADAQAQPPSTCLWAQQSLEVMCDVRKVMKCDEVIKW